MLDESYPHVSDELPEVRRCAIVLLGFLITGLLVGCFLSGVLTAVVLWG